MSVENMSGLKGVCRENVAAPAECYYTECFYAECHNAECRGASTSTAIPIRNIKKVIKHQKCLFCELEDERKQDVFGFHYK
jgi:hypothetical protein